MTSITIEEIQKRLSKTCKCDTCREGKEHANTIANVPHAHHLEWSQRILGIQYRDKKHKKVLKTATR